MFFLALYIGTANRGDDTVPHSKMTILFELI